jgi:soluble lytic murein transglycosylase
MFRATILFILSLSFIILSACQLDAETSRPVLLAQQTETPTPTLTSPSTATSTSTPVQTPTPIPTETPAPTNTPLPTETPVSSDRLAMAQQAYAGGDYETARLEFDALLADPGASPDEQRLALYWRGRSELDLEDTASAIATLQTFLAQYPTDQFARAAQFNLGRAYEQAGRYEEADAAYLASVVPGDPVNVYVYERVGNVRLLTGAYTDTITAYQNGIDATEDTNSKARLREGIAQAELLRGDGGAAIAQYETILSMPQLDNSYRARILRLMGDGYRTLGDIEAARARYLEAVNRYPEAYDSYLALVELVVNDNVPVDEFQRGRVNYHAGSYQPAIAAFERYLAQLPTEPISDTATLTTTETVSDTTIADASTAALPRADEALWLMALSQQALGQYYNAIATFQRLIDEYPTSTHWGEAHFQKGETLLYQGNYGEAQAVWRAFATQNPAHSLAPESLWRAARLAQSEDQVEEAHTQLHALVDTYPNSERASEALYWAGQASYKLEDYEGAIEDWKALVENYPDSELVSFAGYWQAKTLLALGRNDEARAVLTKTSEEGPLSYYRLRARDLLEGRQPETVPLQLPGEAELMSEKAETESWLQQWLGLAETENLAALSAQLQSDPGFERGNTLLELGLRDQALVEFETVKDRWWNDALAMYQLSVYFWERGLGRLSILTAARLIALSPAKDPEDAPLFIQRLYYPIYFPELIFGEAEKYELDPVLLAALIRQESLFELSAHSHAGARGLMQVMPATGEYVAQNIDFSSFDADQLWLPYVSVKFGAWYLDQQLGLFNDHQFAALAAYNAGPANVLEWMKASDDLDIFVESIPFWESRTYIRRIYENLAAYRRLYGPPLID